MGIAALASCSSHDFSDSYDDGGSSERKNEYTHQWIERYGVFDSKHDWTTLRSVEAAISGEFGDRPETRIYNADPEIGGHLIGYSRTPGRLTLDLPKDAGSVYATVAGGEGELLAAGEFAVSDGRVEISSRAVREPSSSRSAHEVSYFDAMVVCEDLGGIGDYDFNDVVLGLRHVAGTNTLKILPMAAGGTLHADVYYGDEHIGEIHDLIVPGSDSGDMLNTRSFDHVSRFYNVTVPSGFTLSSDWKKIRLAVKDGGETITVTGPDRAGEAPQMFCLGGDWYWPTETTPVDEAYPGFAAWTTSMLNASWADSYSSPSRVVMWDVSQVVPNWFTGTTADGTTYKARIDGASSGVDVKSGQIYSLDPPTSLANMFSNNARLTTLDVASDHFDTSLATTFSSTFSGCSGLTELDLSNWDTGNVTTMQNMFYGCSSLMDVNLSGMNTSNVTDVTSMFSGCVSLQNLNISDWDISNVTNSSSMFYNCKSLESVTMNNWKNTSERSDLRRMLASLPGSVNTLVMRDCDFTGTTDLGETVGNYHYGIFESRTSLTTLDVTGWKTPDLKTLYDAFNNCSKIETITGINTWRVPNVTSLKNTFSSCSALKSIDLSNWDTSNVTDMQNMFSGCSSLKDVNLSGMNTSHVTNVSQMFNGCSSLQNLDISDWDISSVTNSGSMFNNCTSLESLTMNRWKYSSDNSVLRTIISSLPSNVKTLVMRDCDFTGTTDLGQTSGNNYNALFHGKSLTTIDVTGWKTPDLTTMKEMFGNCGRLESVIGINDLDVSRVTSMRNMFYECGNLKSLDLSNWNSHNLTSMTFMFYKCQSITELNMSGMDTSKVTDMSSLFNSCYSLRNLDISGWDLSNVTDFSNMFHSCPSDITIKCSRATQAKLLENRTGLGSGVQWVIVD